METQLLGGTIRDDTVLVGAGPGGAMAVGLVSKAIQVLGHKVPKSIVVDCEYTGSIKPEVGILLPKAPELPIEKCVIIHSYLGTGQSLHVLREKYGLQNTPVFTFVISEALLNRGYDGYYLSVGSRSFLPWPRSVPFQKG